MGLAEQRLEFIHGSDEIRDVLALGGQFPGKVPDVPEGVVAQPFVREVLGVRMCGGSWRQRDQPSSDARQIPIVKGRCL